MASLGRLSLSAASTAWQFNRLPLRLPIRALAGNKGKRTMPKTTPPPPPPQQQKKKTNNATERNTQKNQTQAQKTPQNEPQPAKTPKNQTSVPTLEKQVQKNQPKQLQNVPKPKSEQKVQKTQKKQQKVEKKVQKSGQQKKAGKQNSASEARQIKLLKQQERDDKRAEKYLKSAMQSFYAREKKPRKPRSEANPVFFSESLDKKFDQMKVAVRPLGGEVFVDIRNYFTKRTKEFRLQQRPTQKGVMLNREEWAALKAAMVKIDQALEQNADKK